MKKTIKLYYANMENMGDLLNIHICKELFGFDVKRHTVLTAEMSAIGSGLGNFTWSDRKFLYVLQKLFSFNPQNVAIWGTGFISYEKQDRSFFRKNITFHAVRGKLSKQRVEKILNKKLDIPTGDAGLLASYLIKKMPDKKYAVGIVPHFREQDAPYFSSLKNQFNHSVIINLREDPLEVIKQIAQCEVIISSSLHGLIVADSFGIPNLHVIATDKLRGDGFKFKDYYSSFDLEVTPIDLKNETVPALEDIADNYKITKQMVDKKKEELLACFPFK